MRSVYLAIIAFNKMFCAKSLGSQSYLQVVNACKTFVSYLRNLVAELYSMFCPFAFPPPIRQPLCVSLTLDFVVIESSHWLDPHAFIRFILKNLYSLFIVKLLFIHELICVLLLFAFRSFLLLDLP